MDIKELISAAQIAREKAYCPYSHFSVGAALLDKGGKIHTGCNIESVSHTPTTCGERTAFFKAISEGVREFQAIAVIAGPEELSAPVPQYTAPCGVCRQVMAEFCTEDFKIILARSVEDYKVYTLKEIFPCSFVKESLL